MKVREESVNFFSSPFEAIKTIPGYQKYTLHIHPKHGTLPVCIGWDEAGENDIVLHSKGSQHGTVSIDRYFEL